MARAALRTPRAEVLRYPMDPFGPVNPGHQLSVATGTSHFLGPHLPT